MTLSGARRIRVRRFLAKGPDIDQVAHSDGASFRRLSARNFAERIA